MGFRRTTRSLSILALAFAAGAGIVPSSFAQPGFPRIPVWGFAGGWQDSTLLNPRRCGSTYAGPQPDSLVPRSRTITIRFKRDPQAELRPDFGGYRIYRVVQTPDTTNMVLLRRYSLNSSDSLFNWHFSSVDRDSASATFGRFITGVTPAQILVCGHQIAGDSIITFVDPDSCGNYQKVCRRVDHLDRCLSPGDSVFRLVAPPGPHDGFLTWYAVTYEARNQSDANFADLFVPDTSDWSRCGTPGNPLTCPNLNNKRANMFPDPAGPGHLEPTAGTTANLLRVAVVPNPYRASEAWDPAGGHELHFVNLPSAARIQIFTIAGDLIRVLQHNDTTRDFERWDLKNDDGRDVSSGIYMYRVDATVSGQPYTFQYRFVVIR